MNNATKILSDFEAKLISILASKEETVKKMRENDEILFEQYGKKSLEQIRLHKSFQQQPKVLQTSIHLQISSAEMAEDVHRKILGLIEEKNYPVKEALWVNFIGTTKWNFTFNY